MKFTELWFQIRVYVFFGLIALVVGKYLLWMWVISKENRDRKRAEQKKRVREV